MAALLMDVLFHYREQGKYRLHEFAIMPNHFHALMTLAPDVSIEKTMQFIKGGFSYRAKRELGFTSEIWHRGFSEVRIFGEEAYHARRKYTHENPVKEELVRVASDWEYGSAWPGRTLDPCPEYLRG
jgi:putative transposase